MVSKFQWKPFWLATLREPQNDWTATQNRVKYDVFLQAPLFWHNYGKVVSITIDDFQVSTITRGNTHAVFVLVGKKRTRCTASASQEYRFLVFSMTFSSVFCFRNKHWPLLWLATFKVPHRSTLRWNFSAPRFLVTDATLHASFLPASPSIFFFLISDSCLSISF